jgi:hypothetical protein
MHLGKTLRFKKIASDAWHVGAGSAIIEGVRCGVIRDGGRAASKPGHVRMPPKAEVNSDTSITVHLIDLDDTTISQRCSAAPLMLRSLRQPRFSQAIYVPGEVLRCTKWDKLGEVGNSQLRVDLAHTGQGFLRLYEPPRERVACRGHA